MTAELYAILVALKYLQSECIEGAVLFTDSLSSCQLIEGLPANPRRNSVIQEIVEIAATMNVPIQWIPSHCAIEGNDIADELAKAGVYSDRVLENGILINDALHTFNQLRSENTNNWYCTYAEEKGKHFFSIQPSYSHHPWYKNKPLNNLDIRGLNRLMAHAHRVAGHSFANNWLAKMKIVDDPDCDVCLTEDTADHVVLH
nr:uncharacterized protein LOC115264293 [Aedes albopictus]